MPRASKQPRPRSSKKPIPEIPVDDRRKVMLLAAVVTSGGSPLDVHDLAKQHDIPPKLIEATAQQMSDGSRILFEGLRLVQSVASPAQRPGGAPPIATGEDEEDDE